jgi:NADPH:quinone reductase-like Zn-dependent oxidoreductase
MTSSDKNQKAQASGLFELWDLLRELSVYSTLVPPTLLATLSYVVGLLTWRQKKFTPDCDIPDLSGKVALITGANTGIGKETLLRLSKHGPAKIYLAARDEKKAQRAIAEIKDIVPKATITFIQMDLASFESIEKGAQRVTEECSRLDILILNAGKSFASLYMSRADGDRNHGDSMEHYKRRP